MITVSIIEDHEQYRNLLIKLVNDNTKLELNDACSSAEEAMFTLVKRPPAIAIVDIQLKSLTGIELIKNLRGVLADTQFLICTAFQNDENVFQALKAGASGYIVKGSSVTEMENAVIDLHNGGSPMSPYIARKVIRLMQENGTSNKFGLSERELEVISLLSRGLLYKEISDQLNISQNTVKNHCKSIYKRLHVQNKIEAINKYRTL